MVLDSFVWQSQLPGIVCIVGRTNTITIRRPKPQFNGNQWFLIFSSYLFHEACWWYYKTVDFCSIWLNNETLPEIIGRNTSQTLKKCKQFFRWVFVSVCVAFYFWDSISRQSGVVGSILKIFSANTEHNIITNFKLRIFLVFAAA